MPRLYSYRQRAIPRQRSSARRTDVVGAPLRQSQASPAAHSPTHPETAIQRRALASKYRNRAVNHGLLRRGPPKDVQRPPHALLPELRRGQGRERADAPPKVQRQGRTAPRGHGQEVRPRARARGRRRRRGGDGRGGRRAPARRAGQERRRRRRRRGAGAAGARGTVCARRPVYCVAATARNAATRAGNPTARTRSRSTAP